ncbi:Plc1 [Kluyveromyces lactis]|nr:Plc1 [Kluyveromyces lactis]
MDPFMVSCYMMTSQKRLVEPSMRLEFNDVDDEQQAIMPQSILRSLSLEDGSNSDMSSKSTAPSSGNDESFVYDHIYKGIKGFLSRRPSFNGHGNSNNNPNKNKTSELGGPLTYALSSNLRLESTNSGFGSFSAAPLDLPLLKVTRRKRVRYTFHIDQNTVSWNNGKKLIYVDTIKDIRSGDMATNYMDMYNVPGPSRDLWCTIIYSVNKNRLKALHVIAEDAAVFKSFYETTVNLVNSRRKLMEDIAVPNNEQFANIHWQTSVSTKLEDQDKDTLSFADVKRLCNRYHIYCSDNYLYALFIKADTNNNSLLNFPEFQDFVKYLKARPEIEIIWNQIKNKDTKVVDFQSFYQFICDVQGEVISQTNAYKIFKKYCTADELLDVEGLLKFLTKQPFLRLFEEDYSRPLNEYFISSSHNTYLMGKQVVDEVSVEAYTRALQQGCRCIEIDIWQGDHGPVVCHGLFTQSIPLEDVVKTIRKYAFITSPYPLIVSLEIHCKKDYQLMITKIMKEILGDLIFVNSPNTPLLSPEQLKNRIILKSKKTHAVESEIISGSTSSYTSSSSHESLSETNDMRLIKKRGFQKSTTSSSSPNTTTVPVTTKRSNKSLLLSTKIMISDKVHEISGIHGVRFRNFSLPESKTTTHCFSLSEKKFINLDKDETQKLAINKHNRRHLMRIYPHMLRYKSSNFNPIRFWKEGVQMVATNWQTYDLGQQLNHAMFQVSLDRNSIWHSGYVLKPAHLRKEIHKMKDIPVIMERLKREKIHIHLDVISGQMLSLQNCKILAPYVEIELITDNTMESLHLTNCLQPMGYTSNNSTHASGITNMSNTSNGTFGNITSTSTKRVDSNGSNGSTVPLCGSNGTTAVSGLSTEDGILSPPSTPPAVPAPVLSSPQLFSTKCFRDNGFSPVWNASFECTLTNTTFNFVRFTVKNSTQTIATTCVRLNYLKQGYRHLPLYNIKGEKFIFSTLFIRYKEELLKW